MRSTALESAAQQSEMLEVVNALYSSKVVDRLQSHGVVVTHDYAARSGAIPLPATFTIESGEEIGRQSKTGMLFRLYSDSPFRSRKDGGPHDDFERTALAGLRNNPAMPVFRFETFQRRPSLRYATARVMKADCIGCHNQDTQQHQTRLESRGRRGRPRDHSPTRPRYRSDARGAARDVPAGGCGLRGTSTPLWALPGGAFPPHELIHDRRCRRKKSCNGRALGDI